MKFIAIIPARYASTRFPGKPLAMLGGKPIIQRVYEQVSKTLGEVYVATDDERIFNAVESFGGKAVMTSSNHKSGTDRIKEAAETIGTDADVIINVQGDEPFILPEQIETVCKCFDDESTQIATLGKPFDGEQGFEMLQNPNSPKIVIDNNSRAMYFSRSVIPYIRGKERDSWFGEYPFLGDLCRDIGNRHMVAYQRHTQRPAAQHHQASAICIIKRSVTIRTIK